MSCGALLEEPWAAEELLGRDDVTRAGACASDGTTACPDGLDMAAEPVE
jgi:hypothetical protein